MKPPDRTTIALLVALALLAGGYVLVTFVL